MTALKCLRLVPLIKEHCYSSYSRLLLVWPGLHVKTQIQTAWLSSLIDLPGPCCHRKLLTASVDLSRLSSLESLAQPDSWSLPLTEHWQSLRSNATVTCFICSPLKTVNYSFHQVMCICHLLDMSLMLYRLIQRLSGRCGYERFSGNMPRWDDTCMFYPHFLGNIILLCAMIEQNAHMEDNFWNLKGFRFRCMSCNICFCSHTLSL